MAQHAKGPSASGAPENPADEIKRRMKEALERKQQRNAASSGEGVVADANEKMHGLSGHVDTQNYRRKAGGGGS